MSEQTPKDKKDSADAQARVVFQGEAADVLDGIKRFQGEERKKEDGPKTGKKLLEFITESLSETSNYVIARREFPKTIHNRTLINEVKMPCPTTVKEIATRLEKEMGGEKWWIQIFDSTGAEIVGRYINIDVPPVPNFKETSPYGSGLFGTQDGFNRPGFAFRTDDDDDDEDDEEDEEEFMKNMMKQEMAALRLQRIKNMMKQDQGEDSKKSSEWQRERERTEAEIQKQLSDIRHSVASSIKDVSKDFQDAIRSSGLGTTQAIKDISVEIKSMNDKFNSQFKDLDSRHSLSIRDITDKFTGSIKDIQIAINDKVRDIAESIKENKAEKRLHEMEQKAAEKDSLTALRHEIAGIQKDFAIALQSIRSDIQNKNGDGNDKLMTVMFEAMSKSQGQIFEAVNKTLSDRMESVSQSNQTFKDLFLEMNRNMNEKKEASTDPFESTERLVNIASTLAGLSKPGSEDDPAMPFESRLIKAFTDVTPQVLSYMRERKKAGEDVSEEELQERWKAAIAEKAKEIAKGQVDAFKLEIVKKAKELQSKQQKRLTASKAPQTKEQQQAEDEEVEQMAEDALESASQATEEEEVAQEPEQNKEQQTMTKANNESQEISRRVNHVLGIIDQEIDLMPGEAEWIEHAIRYLPRPQLIELAGSKDPKQMLPMLKKYGDADILMTLGMKLFNKDKYNWIMRCLRELSTEVKSMIEEEKKASQPQVQPQKIEKGTPKDEIGIADDSSTGMGDGNVFDEIADGAEEIGG